MPKPTALVLLASALVAGAAFALPPPVAPATPWGVFSVSSGDGRETTEVEISSVLVTNTADARPETTWINEKTERVWVARKRVAKAGAPATLQWTDSRACYQLIETLATLIDLDQPAGGPPLRIDDTSDSGAAYRIEANGLSPVMHRSTTVRLTSGKDVRASAMVKAALDAWRPCWSETPPTLSAKP